MVGVAHNSESGDHYTQASKQVSKCLSDYKAFGTCHPVSKSGGR